MITTSLSISLSFGIVVLRFDAEVLARFGGCWGFLVSVEDDLRFREVLALGGGFLGDEGWCADLETMVPEVESSRWVCAVLLRVDTMVIDADLLFAGLRTCFDVL